MPAEDKEFGRLPTREDTTEEFSFDELAKGLASGRISRGRALKLVGAAILGGGVLTLLPGVAAGQVEADAAGEGCPEDGPAVDNDRCPIRTRRGRRRTRCGDQAGCFCTETVNGNNRCVQLRDEECPAEDECDTNADCREDELCVRVGGCCGNQRRNLCARTCSF